MGTLQRGGVMVALASIFAGMGNSIATSANKLTNAFGFGGATGSNTRSRASTKYVNTRNVHKQKWDFNCRVNNAANGLGYFTNRTTGEQRIFKIANPKHSKTNPVRELSKSAQTYFGV